MLNPFHPAYAEDPYPALAEQRAEALAKAQAARKKRSELLASVKSGKLTIAQVLAKHDERYMPKDVADKLKAQGVWQGEKK